MREQLRAEAERLYLAEDLCSAHTHGRWLRKNREIQEFLNAVTTSRWFRRMFPDFKSITVGNARGRDYGEGRLDGDGHSHIFLPTDLRRELFALHELVHALGHCSHDWAFCSTYLRVVRRVLGPDAWYELRHNFVECGVKHRRRPLPDPWQFDAAGAGSF